VLSRLTIRSILLVAALAALPSPAPACTVAEAMTPMLFEELPAVPTDAVAARVRMLTGIRARIVEMIRGDYSGANLRLAPSASTSCDLHPDEGQTGIVVGWVISSSPDELVIDPLRAPSMAERAEARTEALPAPR
jgi:hypothetical protein